MTPVAPPPFLLIRHGETDWNRDGRLQGQRDVPLNAVGRDQASAVGRSLKRALDDRGLDPTQLRFVASPLGRARETMELLRQAAGLDPSVYRLEDRLAELSFGSWEGLTWSELKRTATDSVRARRHDKWAFVPPGGESYAQLAARVRPWLDTVQPFDIVVAHGGVARALMRLIGGASATDAPNADIWQGRILQFEAGRCRWLSDLS